MTNLKGGGSVFFGSESFDSDGSRWREKSSETSLSMKASTCRVHAVGIDRGGGGGGGGGDGVSDFTAAG